MLKRKCLVLALLCCGIAYIGMGQNIDSLKTEIASCKDDSCQVKLYDLLGKNYLNTNVDSALYYFEKALESISLEKDIQNYYKAKMNIASAYCAKGDKVSLLQVINEIEVFRDNVDNDTYFYKQLGCLHFLNRNIDSAYIAFTTLSEKLDEFNPVECQPKVSSLLNLGLIARKSNLLKEAILHFEEAERIIEERECAINRKAKVYKALGDSYLVFDEKDKSIDYYLKALESPSDGKLTTYSILYNLASNYDFLGDLGNALSTLDKAKNYWKDIGSTRKKQWLILFCNIKIQQEETEEAIESIRKYRNLISSPNNSQEWLNYYDNLSSIYLLENKKDSCIWASNMMNKYLPDVKLNLTEEYFLRKEDLGKVLKTNNVQVSKRFYKVLELKDSIEYIKNRDEINDLRISYETEKKEAQNQLLHQEKEIQSATIQRQRATMFGGLAGLSLLGLLAFQLFRQSKERKRNNETLQAKNAKIETLHKELSHRVKNNLAFVSSLMRMQGRRLESTEAKQAVKEGEARIEAMSLLHRKLYMQEDSSINIKGYLEELCANLQNTYPVTGERPQIKLDIANLEMDGENAVRLGLIINELVTNSFKYAFSNQSNPQINIGIALLKDKDYQMTYSDNGVGLPTEFDIKSSQSLGLKLIHTLTKQLNGQLQTENREGAYFQFDFETTKLAV